MSQTNQPSGTGFSNGIYIKLADGTYEPVIDANGNIISPVIPGDIALTSAHILVGNASNVAAGAALTGDISITNAGVSSVVAKAITGAKLSTGTGYYAVATTTTGGTPVNVFTSTLQFAGTITGVYIISNDTTAGNIIVADSSGTVATIAKGTSSGTMIGAVSLANARFSAGDTLTVVSSTSGNATVFIAFTVT